VHTSPALLQHHYQSVNMSTAVHRFTCAQMSTYICKHCLLLSWDFHDITVSHTKATHTYTLFWTDTWISPKSTCTQQLCMLLMC